MEGNATMGEYDVNMKPALRRVVEAYIGATGAK